MTIPFVTPTEEEVATAEKAVVTPNVPTDIYLSVPNEANATKQVKDTFDFFKLAGMLNAVKSETSVALA